MIYMKNTNVSATHLYVLIAIAESGSFTLAAERLGLTQPGVSHCVRDLETNLGVRLFERRRGESATLTDAGKRALIEARAAVVHLDRLAQTTRHAADEISGTLRLACFPSASNSFLPRLLAAYLSQNPSVKIEVFEGGGKDTERDIRSREVHLGMVSLPTARDFVYFPAYEDELLVALHRDSPIKDTKGRISLRALSKTPILMPDEPTASLVESAFAAAGCRPHAAVSVENSSMRLELVRLGLGATLVPEKNLPALRQLRGLRLLHIHPRITRHVAFAALSVESLPPAATKFVELLRKVNAP
jgi:DNA-binding transcriptional LysR family regulator